MKILRRFGMPRGMRHYSIHSSSRHHTWKTLSTKSLSVFICFAFLLVLAGQAGLFSFLSSTLQRNNQVPHALQGNAPLRYAPASGSAFAPSKTAAIDPNLAAQLKSQSKAVAQGVAVNTKHVKVLAEHRSANSTEYLNADGTKTLIYTAQATSYQDSDGNWQSINNVLIKGSGGTWHTKANSWIASFGNATKQGITITKDGQSFNLMPVDANSVEPSVTGTGSNQTLTYKNLWNGVNLEYVISGSQVKENVILTKPGTASQYSFRFSGSNLTPVTSQPGSYALDGAFSGFDIAAPTVRLHNRGVSTTNSAVSQTVTANVVTVSLNTQWLSTLSAKNYPLVIDPTVFTVPAGSNYNNFTASGFSCGPGGGCGNSVGHDAIVNDYWRFIYQTAVPSSAGQYLVSAKLHVQMPTPDGNDYGTTGNETITVGHASCTNGFNCIDTSVNNYGQASATIASSGDIEMAPLYRAAVAAGDTSPWMIVNGDEGTADTYKFFDDTKTSVTFTYETLPTQSTIGTAAPVDGGTAASLQPTLTSTAPTDPDGPGPIQYRYIVGMAKNLPQNDTTFHIKQGVVGVIADSGLLSQAQWTLPANVLQDGTTYYWQPVVWDSYAGSPQVYGPVYSFKVNLRNGQDSTQALDTQGPVSVDMATGNVSTSNQTNSLAALGGTIGVGMSYNSPQKSSPGLIGQYWNDPAGTLTFPSSAPAITRTDSNVNFSWGAGSPYAGVVANDHFLARWTGYFVAPQNGTYQFGTTSDDRSRIFLNGSSTAYVDGWTANPANQFGAGVTLTSGQVIQVTYEYAEITGDASAQMLVKTTDGTIASQVIPTTWLQTGIQPIATPHGLVGHYYTDDGSHTFPTNAADPNRTFLVRTDPSLNLNWGASSPVLNGPTDHFMVRWTGFFTAPVTDTYTFGAGSDDGVRVIINGSNTIVNSWTNHGASPIIYASSGVSLTQGQTIPITVEYYEDTGNAQMGLYVEQASLGNPQGVPVTNSWLSPGTAVLPAGWNLSLDADGSAKYDYTVINQSSVTLYDASGQSYEYTYANGGFTPPAGEAGQMVRNGDGTITLRDSDGKTYIFNIDGTIQSITSASDDLHPAALQYTYSGSPAHLTQITDGVTSSRWMKLLYSGDANCPSVPSGFLSTTPANMICASSGSDGTTTSFFYTADTNGTPRLARLVLPGSETTDYGYDAAGRISQIRDQLANDAVSAGVRSQDGTELTQITYDALGRASSVTLPAATAGATRQAHSYAYLPNNTSLMHVTNATEPNGFTRKVTYDGTFRTLTDTDIANLTSTTVWNPKKDLPFSITAPTGLETTYLYDYADRLTDTYGPAPGAWFGADRKPLATPTDYTGQVQHNQTAYDQGINGLATAYYDVTTASNGTGGTTAVLFGAPKSHATGIGTASGDVMQTWNATPPFTPDSGYGWGASLSGDIHLTATGSYSFRVFSNDGVRLWVDDNLIVDDWNDGTQRSHANGSFAAAYNPTDDTQNWHRVRLDYYNKAGDTNARLELYMTPPGGIETSALGSILTPMYGLATTHTAYDSSSSVGNEITTNSYGTNPELGLLQSGTVDPSGLALTTTSSYEAKAATGSYLRQTAKTLPGGATTNYTYYGATETRQNPCNASQTFSEAGMLKITTQPDPDGAGPKTGVATEVVYDNSGNVVATRINADSWHCTMYDARGRKTQEVIPALTNTSHVTRSARTVTYNYAVGGNPLVSSVADASGTVKTTMDLLGRIASYADTLANTSTITTNYTYDNLGRLITKDGGGTEAYTYDNYNRLTAQSVNGASVATPTYDAYGRLQSVVFNATSATTPLTMSVGYDTFGRENSVTYNYWANTGSTNDSETFSQSGKVISGSAGGQPQSYAYDKAGRLTTASVGMGSQGTNTYTYSYAAPTTCTGSYNANAGKDSNRTSQTLTSSFWGSTTTNYCYNNADQLVSSTDRYYPTVAYDDHGNLTSTSYLTDVEYDSSDRAVYLYGNGTETATFDPIDRLSTDINDTYVYSDATNVPLGIWQVGTTLNTRFVQLPGGVLMSLNSTSATNGSNVYSLPDLRGNVMATTNGTGAQSPGNLFQYDPYGQLISTIISPNNTQNYDNLAWKGTKGIPTYGRINNFIQLGSRLYSPALGRFMQSDAIEGGNENAYVYSQDPINSEDLTGAFSVWGGVKSLWSAACGGWWVLTCIPGTEELEVFHAVGKGAQIAHNAEKGKAAEEAALKAYQKTHGVQNVTLHGKGSGVRTSQGMRFPDLTVNGAKGRFYVEVKSGNSPYSRLQQQKDAEIYKTLGIPTEVYRVP